MKEGKQSLSGQGQRIADASIYTNDVYFQEPKEYFVKIANRIQGDDASGKGPSSILDVGCANGALLHYLHQRFPESRISGLEPVEALCESARQALPGAIMYCHGLLDSRITPEPSQCVIMAGVMGIFNDPEPVMQRLLALSEKDGTIYVFSPFNEEPIDVVLEYRRAPDGPWETGHNLFSMKTMESIAAKLGLDYEWEPFRMSKPLSKGEDPMRSWTELFRDDPNQIVYGTNMFSTMKLLVLRRNAV